MKYFHSVSPISLVLCIFLSAFFFASCRTVKSIQGTNMKKRSAKFLLQKMEEQRYSYDWLAAKAKVKFESKDQNVSFTVQMRVKHDSIIWLKVQKVSVEGIRVRMSPDRIEMLNRQDNQYIVETFASIQDKMPIPFGFREVEDLLAGNPFMKDDIDFDVTVDSLYYILDAELKGSKKSTTGKGTVKIWLDGAYHLVKLYAEIDGNSVEANYSDFKAIDSGHFIAHEKEIKLNSPESGEIRFKIDFNKLELNSPQDLKFEIPDHYEQIITGNKIPRK